MKGPVREEGSASERRRGVPVKERGECQWKGSASEGVRGDRVRGRGRGGGGCANERR